jgi:hypothetical protein
MWSLQFSIYLKGSDDIDIAVLTIVQCKYMQTTRVVAKQKQELSLFQKKNKSYQLCGAVYHDNRMPHSFIMY